MGDMGDLYRDMRAESIERKESNRNRSLLILKENEIPHRMLTLDHYRVADVLDFWPSTGLFINLKTQERGRGVFNLIRKVTGTNGRK